MQIPNKNLSNRRDETIAGGIIFLFCLFIAFNFGKCSVGNVRESKNTVESSKPKAVALKKTEQQQQQEQQQERRDNYYAKTTRPLKSYYTREGTHCIAMNMNHETLSIQCDFTRRYRFNAKNGRWERYAGIID